jgi:TIR domain
LQDAGLRVWFAPHDIQGGRKLHEQIDQAIRIYEKLLLVLSTDSIRSRWVEFEIRQARKREVAERRRLLFPVRLVDYEAIKAWKCFDADTAKDLATEIREYYIPDFTAWKDHDAFEAAIARLLRDLKAAERQPEGSRPIG